MELPPYHSFDPTLLSDIQKKLLTEEGDDDPFLEIRKRYSSYLPSGNEGMPYYFLLIMRQFSFNSQNFLDEWEYYSFIDKESDIKLRCICSHFISDIFLLRNKYNLNVLPVGSSCVRKIYPISSSLLRTFQIQNRTVKYSRKFRQCLECKKQNIPLSEEKIRCKKCIDKNNLNQDLKFCLQCGDSCQTGLNCPKHPTVILSPIEAIKIQKKLKKKIIKNGE